MEIVTKTNDPSFWEVPSIRVSVSHDDGRFALAATGWAHRIFVWEQKYFDTSDAGVPSHPITTLPLRDDLFFQVGGDSALLEAAHDPRTVREVEIVCEENFRTVDYLPLLHGIVPEFIVTSLEALPGFDAVTVNANREIVQPPEWVGRGITIVDLPVNTLPSSRSGECPLIYATRWMRLIAWDNGMLTIWSKPTGLWPDDGVRIPHNAVPSRSADWLDGITDGTHRDMSWRVKSFFDDVTAHELYFMGTWNTEIEHWESSVLDILSSATISADSSAVAKRRHDFAVLTHYLNRVRHSQRALLRRADVVSGLKLYYPQAADTLRQQATVLDSMLLTSRAYLNRSFSLLQLLSQQVEAAATERAREATDRINGLLSIVTAVLLVPTLVAGIYGTNVVELSPESGGNLPELFLAMLSASFFSISGIYFHLKRTPGLFVRMSALLGLFFLIVTVLQRVGWDEISTGIGFSSFVVAGAVIIVGGRYLAAKNGKVKKR